MYEVSARMFKIGTDFIRIDVKNGQLGLIPTGFNRLDEEETLKFSIRLKDLSENISINKPHLIEIYKASEDKFYGPFVGPVLPVDDVPGLQEALMV